MSKDTISRITDKVIEDTTEWCNRPLESVYPVMFIDAIFVRVRCGDSFCQTCCKARGLHTMVRPQFSIGGRFALCQASGFSSR